jgi:translation initiation factor IF-1
MSKDNVLEFEGIVQDCSKDKFKVKVNDNYVVVCSLGGKIRQNDVRILPGDKVKIEASVYDTAKGRIVYRIK